MSLERFCRRPPVTVKPSQTVEQAAIEMNEKHVGSVIVVDPEGRPAGILTDRDVACRTGNSPALTDFMDFKGS